MQTAYPNKDKANPESAAWQATDLLELLRACSSSFARSAVEFHFSLQGLPAVRAANCHDELVAYIAVIETELVQARAEIERLKNAPCVHDQASAFLKSTNPNY